MNFEVEFKVNVNILGQLKVKKNYMYLREMGESVKTYRQSIWKIDYNSFPLKKRVDHKIGRCTLYLYISKVHQPTLAMGLLTQINPEFFKSALDDES